MFGSQLEAAAYLSGMIDGEGSVALSKTSTGASGRVTIYNSELALIRASQAALEMLGVEFNQYERNPKPADLGTRPQYILQVGKRSAVAKLAQHISLRHPVKAQRLQEILEHYKTTRLWTTRSHWPTTQVRTLLQEGHSRREIAEQFGVSKSTIQRWATT